jgi:hypothetical protein
MWPRSSFRPALHRTGLHCTLQHVKLVVRPIKHKHLCVRKQFIYFLLVISQKNKDIDMAPTEDQPSPPPGRSSIASRVKRKRSTRRGVGAGLAALFGHHGAAAHASPPAGAAAVPAVPLTTRTRTRTSRAADACFVEQMEAGRATSRRRLMVDGGDVMGASSSSPRARPSLSRTPPRIDPERQRHIDTIKSKLGRYKHHGTGNPLAMRSPSTPRTLAVDNLAAIIRSGHLGVDRSDLSGSIPKLRTERGNVASGAFWVNRVELAGHYGWTGLILQPNVDTSTSLPISNVYLFLVTDDEERIDLETLLKEEEGDRNGKSRWNEVRDRVVTIEQLAARLEKLRSF